MVCDRKMWGRWFASNCDVCFHLGCLSSQAFVLSSRQPCGSQCWERSLHGGLGRGSAPGTWPCDSGEAEVGSHIHAEACPGTSFSVLMTGLPFSPSTSPWSLELFKATHVAWELKGLKRTHSRHQSWWKGPHKEICIFNMKKIIGIW